MCLDMFEFKSIILYKILQKEIPIFNVKVQQ